MNTCDACKHWQDAKKWEIHGVVLACCDKLTSDENPNDAAVVVYSDSDPIATGPKFGCIFHETK